MKKISVIIPTYNSWLTLKSCIDSIIKQTLKPLEVIVVNNGSTDKTADNVKKNFKGVKVVTLKKNTGVTGGRNAGIKGASKKADYLFFFDHDMVADRKMLEELVKVAESDKNIGIVTPKIYYWEDKNRIWSAGTGMNLWTGQVLFRGGIDRGQYDRVEEVQVAPAAMLVKREVLSKVIGFDNQYFATFEDTDFCFKARQEGYKTFYAPHAISYHKISISPASEKDRLLSRSYLVARNRIIFMERYGKNFYLFLLFSPIYALNFLKIAITRKQLRNFYQFMKGYMESIRRELLFRRWLSHVPFSFLTSIKNSIGGKSLSVLDVGCGNGNLMQILNSKKIWKVTGIEIYKLDAERAMESGVYKEVILGDIRKLKILVKNRKFDVAFSSQVLEHLEKNESLRVLDSMEKVARKVVVTTPKGFFEKHEPFFDEGDNEHQIHKSGWEVSDYKDRGYVVRGIGVEFIYGEHGIARYKVWNKSPLLEPVKIGFEILAFLLAPIVYYLPSMATGLLAIKENEE